MSPFRTWLAFRKPARLRPADSGPALIQDRKIDARRVALAGIDVFTGPVELYRLRPCALFRSLPIIGEVEGIGSCAETAGRAAKPVTVVDMLTFWSEMQFGTERMNQTGKAAAGPGRAKGER